MAGRRRSARSGFLLAAPLIASVAACAPDPGEGPPAAATRSEAPAIGSETSAATPQSRTWRPEDSEVWDPEPAVVTPGVAGAPPSDAIILFDGSDLSAWVHEDGSDARWSVEDGATTVVPGTGDIRTRDGFGDVQLHIEWRTPAEVSGDGQGRGNSGIFFMERYELQVLDSYENRTYANGQAGSIYKQHMPRVNASRGPGVWQTYDVVFTAPRFDAAGALLRPARMTVFHNGVLIHDHAELLGPTVFIGPPEHEPHEDRAPLRLQDHGNPVSYRNIWLRELSGDAGRADSVRTAAAREVEAREVAFASTMADRDFEAFLGFIAEEAIFFAGDRPLRGRGAIGAAWQGYFEGPTAPFSWAPDLVEVLDSGALALSSGPVRNPEGEDVGRFNSIWRKGADGEWHVVFDKGCP